MKREHPAPRAARGTAGAVGGAPHSPGAPPSPTKATAHATTSRSLVALSPATLTFRRSAPLSAGSVHVAGRSTQSQRPSRSVRAGRLQPAAGASQGSRTTLGTTKDRPGWGPRGGRRGDAADSGTEALSLAKLEPSPPGRRTPRHCSPIAVLNT